MAAKSNYFKESGFHTWRFHSVGKKKTTSCSFGLPPEGSCTYKVQAMQPVVRVLPAFAALLVSSAFAQQPTPILPDSRLTPGDTFEISGQDVCVPCYTKKVRAVSQEVKREVYREYGITSHGRDDYEIDHLIPLELGYRLAYNGDVATDQLAVFQGASWKKA